MTAHNDFRGLNLSKIKEMMRTPLIVDGRRVFDPDAMRQLGFVYKGVGANNE
jgi:UDP-N-acetyl-D-mannosaminuronate dehydrogenase